MKKNASRARANSFVRAAFYFTIALLYAPLVTILLYSFLVPDPREWGSHYWGLELYSKLFQNESIRAALLRSVKIAFYAATGATLVGTSAAWALERRNFRGKKLLDLITLFPLAMPELVLGLSLLIWFVFLQITLGTLSLTLAHMSFSLSYVIVTVRSRLHTLDVSVLDAAQDLGASRPQIFRWVLWPLIKPGVMAGWLMAFMLSFDDFLISFYTSGAGMDTLPLKLYAMIKFDLNPQLYSLGSLMILAGFALMGIIFFSTRVNGARGPKAF